MRQTRPRRVRVVRYYAPDGKRCAKGMPGATKRSELSETYYAKLGGRKVSLRTADEGQAWEELRRLLRDRAERRSGLRDAYTDAAAAPLETHVEAMAGVLLAKGTGAEQVEQVKGNVLRLAAAAGWWRLADMTADSCLHALARLVRERGIGLETRNRYLRHAKQFARWCGRSDRLRKNPLEGLSPLPADTDPRHRRRVPTEEEIGKLMAYLHGPGAKARYGMTGPQRALGYLTCMATGFRAAELRSLARANFDLEAGSVTVVAGYSKNKRTDVQPLPPWLVAELREWFAAGGGCWENFPPKGMGKLVLRPDLEASGVPWSVPSPEGELFFDFHALRHYYITWAANRPGISPRTLQALARHSSPALTLKVYAKAKREDVRAAVDGLPRPGGKGG